MRYFSSDFHLGSAFINKYARRPWMTAREAALDVISNVNSTCRDDDVLVHCGDFSLQSTDRHGDVDDVPIPKSTREWLWSFTPSVFLLQGNHDASNGDESMAKSMTVDLSPSWRNVYVSHYPSSHDWYRGPASIAKQWLARDGYTDQHESYSFADKLCKGTRRPAIALCGHVHDAWLVQFDYEHGVLNVNVGLDVWSYKPVSDMQIIKILEFLKAQRIQKLDRLFTWKRADLERAMRENDRHVKNDRARRKAEKHAKKGLTPEECERRKLAAIEKKLWKGEYIGKSGFDKKIFDAVKKGF